MMEKNKKNAGFTLVEILVAITIMALTGGILLSSFTVAIKLNARAEREYEVCQQAQVVIEKLLCSENVRTAVGAAINANKNGNPDYLKSFAENEIEITVNEETAGITALKSENPLLERVGLKLSKYDNSRNTILCTITVTVKDDGSEVYQLTGYRELYLVGITGGSQT